MRRYYLKYEYYKPQRSQDSTSTLLGLTPVTINKYFIDKYELEVVDGIDYSSPQGIIQYETPGGNGGATISTGRKVKRIDLKGKIIGKRNIDRTIQFRTDNNRRILSQRDISIKSREYQDPLDIQKEIDRIKDNGYIVTLIYKDTNSYSKSLYSKWIIENFDSSLDGGFNHLNFTLTLKEYRQANIKTTKVNQVNTKAKLDFISNLRTQLTVNQ
jgi:hypothetical protein